MYPLNKRNVILAFTLEQSSKTDYIIFYLLNNIREKVI